jgi:hypothetical protein
MRSKAGMKSRRNDLFIPIVLVLNSIKKFEKKEQVFFEGIK